MSVSEKDYRSMARAAVAETEVSNLLHTRPAMVLERIACGGGETCWYFCDTARTLDSVVSRLRPGSCVSFYFDGRIKRANYSPDLLPRIQSLIDQAIDIVFGVLADDEITIEVEFLSGSGELLEATSRLNSSSRVFFGHFPRRDNDAVNAVTLQLPDRDGIVRSHAH